MNGISPFSFFWNVLKVWFYLLLDIERLPVGVWVIAILQMGGIQAPDYD